MGRAIADAADELLEGLEGASLDVVFVFVSAHFSPYYDRVPAALRARLGAEVRIVGCSGSAVIAGDQELEESPGVCLVGAHLPGTQVCPFYARDEELAALYAKDGAWEARVGVPASEEPCFVLLPEPFTCDVGMLLRGLDHAFPSARKVGGLASGARQPGEHALFVDDEVHDHGMVGVALAGNVQLDTLVAQGCRSIGQPAFVTRCHNNLILELDGRPPFEVLQETFDALEPADQELFRKALHIGVLGGQPEQSSTEFLVRDIAGIDAKTGALAVGTLLAPHAVVQLHVRDARTSSHDLQHVLGQHAQAYGRRPASGALIFSCLGRGKGLYGMPHHDAATFQQLLGPAPLGGFFCNGEVGPVGGRTHLHGYTGAFGLFRPRTVH